ncbi:MAG: ATP synthase F1 subunit delta [Desulfovibrionaceae bacterium]
MTGNIVSRRYAKALYAVADKQGKLEAFGAQLSGLADALSQAPEAQRFFRNPVFTPAEKKAVLEKLASDLAMDPVVKNFCDLLADKERLAELAAIAADFKKMLEAKQGVISGEMLTVSPLSPERQKDLVDRLEKQTGRKLVLDFAAAPEILGGVVLKMGDRVLDASLRAQLNMLKEQIKRGE